jgi:signal recognition particle GTPase
MKKTLILLALIATLGLVGCETTNNKDVVAVDTKKTVQIDKRLLQECPELATAKEPTEEQLLVASKDWLEKYKACREWKHDLNETVKKAFNVQ